LRALILGVLVTTVTALVLSGRLLARHRFARLRSAGRDALWESLGTLPDGRPTVVAFSTPSCAACWTAQKPALAALQERVRDGVRVIAVDAAQQPRVARAFGVLTVPATVVLDQSGGVLAANQGFATADRLAAQLHLGKLPAVPNAHQRGA